MMVCSECGRPVRRCYGSRDGWETWQHVDPSEGIDCADVRGDRRWSPIQSRFSTDSVRSDSVAERN